MKAEEAETFPWFGKLNNPRKQAILNMLFNLGLTRFSKFKKMIACIEASDAVAAREMLDSKWAKQVKGRAVRELNYA